MILAWGGTRRGRRGAHHHLGSKQSQGLTNWRRRTRRRTANGGRATDQRMLPGHEALGGHGQQQPPLPNRTVYDFCGRRRAASLRCHPLCPLFEAIHLSTGSFRFQFPSHCRPTIDEWDSAAFRCTITSICATRCRAARRLSPTDPFAAKRDRYGPVAMVTYVAVSRLRPRHRARSHSHASSVHTAARRI